MTKRELVADLKRCGAKRDLEDKIYETYSIKKGFIERSIKFKKGTSIIAKVVGMRMKNLSIECEGKRVGDIGIGPGMSLRMEFRIIGKILDKYSRKPEKRTFICSFRNNNALKFGKRPEDFKGILGYTNLIEVKDFDLPSLGVQFIKRELGKENYATDDPKQIMDIHDGMFLCREIDEDIYNYLYDLSKKENIYVIGVRRKDNIFPNTLISEL